MPARPRTRLRLRPLVAALALVAATAAGARAGPSRRARHPAVDGAQECTSCHAVTTPEVVEAWNDSPHGIALVKCFVCHGSAGADFEPRPSAARCQACHAVQAAALARRPVKDCFACHAPHALTANPHG